jgi:LCP family protein required for cell wall assembly
MTDTVEPNAPVRAPGQRRAHSRFRRTQGLWGTLGVTALATVLPGSGFLYAGRRLLGLLLLLPFLVAVGVAGWYVVQNRDVAMHVAVDPGRLVVAAVVVVVVLMVWVASLLLTYLMVRPRSRPRSHTMVGSAFVLLMCIAVAAPLAVAARYSLVQKDLVENVFEHNKSATAPVDVTEEDPWGGRDRVNVLLLGGDGNVHREGVRTDSVILASMDVRSGRTVLFSLPRNLEEVPFTKGSPLAELYPNGFDGDGDVSNWLLNAVYRMVPALHPGVLGKSDNEGADAMKLAVEGALGLPVDYYVLVNLAGFRNIVDAIGGVTVNINEPVAIGGVTDLGIPPDDYLQPGPNQRLDGFRALWFARGRYGSDDYQRMERQRCMIDAIIDEADPLNLLRRYQALAAVGKRIVRTDIPSELLPAFVDLATQMKNSQVRSVVFRSSEEFAPSNPDYPWMRRKVRKALKPPKSSSSGEVRGGPIDEAPEATTPSAPDTPSESPSEAPAAAVDTGESCAYHPAS